MEKLLDAAGLNPLTAIAFGVALAIIVAVRQMGIAMGAKAAPLPPTRAAEVAAVIVDPTALNKLTGQVETLNETLSEIVDVGREMVKVNSHMAMEISRCREELRIHREIRRG